MKESDGELFLNPSLSPISFTSQNSKENLNANSPTLEYSDYPNSKAEIVKEEASDVQTVIENDCFNDYPEFLFRS